MSPRPIQPSIRTHGGAPDPRDEIREALSQWASGVAVLAVTDGEEIDAITVSAFSAVSLDPPLVLACVSEQSSTIPTLLEEGRFTVSVLAEGQKRVASAVAQRLTDSTAGFRTDGDPVLEGSLVAFVCRLRDAHPGGDHRIVVGEVERVELGRRDDPLVYFRREYRQLR